VRQLFPFDGPRLTGWEAFIADGRGGGAVVCGAVVCGAVVCGAVASGAVASGAAAQAFEGAAQQAGHVHLGQSHFSGDVALRFVAVKAQQHDGFLAFRQLGQQFPQRLQVDDLVEFGVIVAQRVTERWVVGTGGPGDGGVEGPPFLVGRTSFPFR
jgi:hypothetical protein